MTTRNAGHESGDPILDAAGRRLFRARVLYIKAVTASECERVRLYQDFLDRAPGEWTRNERMRLLDEAKRKLVAAEARANDVFEAVVNGGVDP